MKPHSRFVNAGADAGQRGWSWRLVLKGVADVTGKLVTFGVMVLAARTLTPAAFGVVALASTTGWLLGVATDAGWSMHLARAVARRRDAWWAIAGNVLRRRSQAALVALVVTAVAARWLVPAEYALAFTLLVGAQLAGAVLDTAMHLFRGLERAEFEAVIHAAQRLVAGVLASVALTARADAGALGLALLLPPLAALAAVALEARHLRTECPSTSAAPAMTWPDVRRQVLPLGAGALLSALYFRCDVYFVEHWHGLDAAGEYNAVFRLVEAIRLAPAAVLAVTFPRLVRAHDLAPVARLSIALTALGLVAAALVALPASSLVTLAYGARYASSAGTLALLALALPFFFLNYALTHQVIGWDGERAYLRMAAAALVANVAANVALVPAWGARGAALATLLTEAVVTAGCLIALRRPRASAVAAVAGSPVA